MAVEHRSAYPSEWATMAAIATMLGKTPETLRNWARQSEVDRGARTGLTTDEKARPIALEKEVPELRRANEILKATSVFFAPEFDGRMKRWFVSPMRTKPPGKSRRSDPFCSLHLERLVADMGLIGTERGRAFKVATTSDDRLPQPADLVDRDAAAPGPHRLWVAHLTCVKTHTGWVYVPFIIDVFSRRTIGWQASTSLPSDLAIDALEMIIYSCHDQDLSILVHHSDRGVRYLSIRFTERLGEAGVVASVGPKGDSYDNALTESFNGLYKNKLIQRQRPWRNVEHVDWETLKYVDWFNNRRIHSSLDDLSPAEFESVFYAETEEVTSAASETTKSLRNPL